MRNHSVFALVGLLVLAILAGCSESPTESPRPSVSPSAAPTGASLVGTWELVKFEGKPLLDEEPQVSWEFGDTEVRITIDERTLKGTYEIGGTTTPKRITITVEGQPEVGRGVFRLTEDTLVVKISEEDTGFAQNFEPEQDYDLMEFRRK